MMSSFTTEVITIGPELSSPYKIEIYRFDSGKPGPHVYLQSGVHGAELQGHAVIAELKDWLEKNEFLGTWTLVPFANPIALANHQGEFTSGRFDPISGHNWNRDYHYLVTEGEETATKINIKTFVDRCGEQEPEEIRESFKNALAEKLKAIREISSPYGLRLGPLITLTLQEIFVQADIVLDLHTAHKSDRYLYAAESCKEEVKDFNFPAALLIPEEFADAGDESAFVPWYKLNNELKSRNLVNLKPVSAFTLELGDQEVIDSQLAKTDCLNILNYLKGKGAHDQQVLSLETSTQFCYLKNFKTYYTSENCLVEYIAAPGSAVKKGSVLYRYFNSSQKMKWQEVKALADGYVISRANSSNLRFGQNIYQLMEETFT